MSERTKRQGGAHGNLYALRGDVMHALRARGFRLPLGIYRTDPLLMAAICFGLDPGRFHWDRERIFVAWNAGWSFKPLRWWHLDDLRAHMKRMGRQAQGWLETQAIKQHLAIDRRLPETFPRTAAELVGQWIRTFPKAARHAYLTNPLSFLARRRLLAPRDWSLATRPPKLISQ